MIKILFNYFIFPGIIFLTISGMFISWIDRKITAKLQWRVGPPILQPFYDIRKLFIKEILIPYEANQWTFIISPLVSFAVIIIISNIILLTYINPAKSFIGDVIVILYLFAIPPLMNILGASASANPYASLGASREIKSILSYELPFIICLLIPIIKTKSILLGKILLYQQASGSFIYHVSGIIAFIISIICFQAKMGLAPFDMAEAETELAGGSHVEYSGPLLAFLKLNKMMLMVIGPLFLCLVYWGGGSILGLVIKYLIVLTIMILIRNTNPRLRIDQSVKFFWSIIVGLSFIALIFAVLGF